MATVRIYAAADDGYVQGLALGDYATARAASTSSNATDATAFIGQRFSSPFYTVNRALEWFDTTVTNIPAAATITGVVLGVTAATDSSTTDFVIKVYQFNWASPIADEQEANYDGAYGGSATAEGTLRDTASGWTTDTEYTMSVDPANIDTTNGTGYALVSEEDVNNSAPTGNEYVAYCTADDATESKRPYLDVTYTLPGQPTNARTFGVPFARPAGFGGVRIGG